MALKNRLCPRIQTAPEEVWRPRKSFVDKSKPLNKVIVSFVKPTGTLEEQTSFNNCSSMRESVDRINPHFEHAYIPGDVLRYLGTYHYHMTSHLTPIRSHVDDDVHSERSYGETAPGYSQGVTSRANILSHMAKYKTSWVENAIQNRVQTALRRSPILVKGKNPNNFETPFEKSLRTKDTSTKGMRNGKRFDLLPISKYLSQFRKQTRVSKEEKRWPLVRISSVRRMPSLTPPNSQQCYSQCSCSRCYRRNTFFTERDHFKPQEARSLPTRGQATFVDIREQLPGLYKKQYNAPVVRMGKELSLVKEKIALPVVT